eukprot:TRINITY_DN48145_c0_g1_i1.p4 TRINITY_DN48145_c0_g1~~TRINITY_DN48145_c0_g1_i1.p4  ORF type:complete len:103 (-),score=21.84 TRINITY_DN48145_c0_g1_i1:112-393(-)
MQRVISCNATIKYSKQKQIATPSSMGVVTHIDRRACIGICLGGTLLIPSTSMAVTKPPPTAGIGSSKKELAKMRNARKAALREKLAQVKEEAK